MATVDLKYKREYGRFNKNAGEIGEMAKYVTRGFSAVH